ESALCATEDARAPSRNLPRAMVGGVAAVIAVYALVNLALLRALPAAALARSTLPAPRAAQASFGARGGVAITLLSLVSLPPLINAIMMIGSRVLFAMGR